MTYVVLLGCLGVQAQIANYGSPYARFGMGEFQPSVGAAFGGLGGMQAALAHPLWINTENPASLGQGALTRMELGTQARFSFLRTDDQALTKSNINLNHLALAVPVGKSMGTALSFTPFAITNYDVSGGGVVDPGGGEVPYQVDEFYTGRGGFNRLAWAWGWQINPHWRVGYAANALFGKSVREFRRVFPDSIQAFNVRVQDQWSVLDLYHQVGVQFQPGKPRSTWRGTWGLSLRLPFEAALRQTLLAERFTLIAGNPRVRDTVYSMPESQGDLTMPLKISLGYWIEKEGKAGTGMEFNYEPLSQWRVMGRTDSLQNQWTLRWGWYRMVNPGGGSSGRSMIYRAGLRYSPGGLRLRDCSIPEAGIHLGLGIPLRRSVSVLNFGLEAGRWGTLRQGLLREDFVRFNLSLNLNDRWFIRRVYD
ncbi:MAG: hypothetical protein EBR22_01070 [Cytophagia bacterium]|nr:hypothetical protein [Cytophagia bacterium]